MTSHCSALLRIAALALATAPPARAAPAQRIDVENLCRFVAENLYESDPATGTDRVYKTRLFAAAGVSARSDSPAVIASKMQLWWSRKQQHLVCNTPNSVVRNGSLLKLAVDSSSTDFINDAVRCWKVDLNRVDADGTTVLDFIDEQREKYRGSPRYDTLNRYRTIFSNAGAMHASELTR